MTALIVIGAILLVLFLLSRIRIGGLVRYDEDGLVAKGKLGLFQMRLYPPKPKKEKPPKPKKPKKEPPPQAEDHPKKKGGTLSLLKDLIPVACQAVNHLRKKLRVDRLDLWLVLGGEDPAQVAMYYGYANAAVGALLHPLESAFHIRERQFHIAASFAQRETLVTLEAQVTLTVGQALALLVRYGWKALKIFLKHSKTPKMSRKEAA